MDPERTGFLSAPAAATPELVDVSASVAHAVTMVPLEVEMDGAQSLAQPPPPAPPAAPPAAPAPQLVGGSGATTIVSSRVSTLPIIYRGTSVKLAHRQTIVALPDHMDFSDVWSPTGLFPN